MLRKSALDRNGHRAWPFSYFRLWKVVLAVICLYVYLTLFVVPDVSSLVWQNPATTAFMERYLDEAGTEAMLYQEWVPFDEISAALKDAVLVAEDDAFFEHRGIDLAQIKTSIEDSWRNGKRLRGASTITQQLAKNLYLSPSRSPLRKLREILIAQRLEKHLGKERIFEIYLNVIEWGAGVYGAEAASWYYFHKPARALNEQEAVFLAAIIPNPQWLSSPGAKRALHKREQMIVRRLERRPSRF